MNKLIINMISIAIIASISNVASAEYMMKIPLERSQGGFLADNSIKFVGASSIPDTEEPESPEEEPVPEGLEGYQNINGQMQCTANGSSSSCIADEMITAISSQYNNVINVSVNAGYSNCGLGCQSTYSVGLSVRIDGAVQDIVDKASIIVFTDANNSTINCLVSDKSIFMTMDNTTYQDEYNTRVSCKLDGYNAPSSAGIVNYSVSIK
ncbi:TPA: hypothetical protein ACXK4S_000664 [Pseudomonas aeruginosa]